MYTYEAIVVSTYDADTVRLDINQGFNDWKRNQSIRLYGINAPEVRGKERPKGLISRDWLRAKIPAGTEIIVKTHKDKTGKYGRWLGELFLDSVNLNDEMVKKGLAEYKSY